MHQYEKYCLGFFQAKYDLKNRGRHMTDYACEYWKRHTVEFRAGYYDAWYDGAVGHDWDA